jgi:predicted enzyme related to lactoylglutathione lyase
VPASELRRRQKKQPVSRDVGACIIPSAESSPASWNLDFWVDDTDTAVARAESLGARVVVRPYDTPFFRQAVLSDRVGAISQPLSAG